MMLAGFKICLTVSSLYASVRLLGLSVDWMRYFFDDLKPPKKTRRRNRYYDDLEDI